MTVTIATIVELIDSSDKWWHKAVEVSLEEATKPIRAITGLEVVSKMLL